MFQFFYISKLTQLQTRGSKGLIAQWIRARVSEARSRGFNSLFAQSKSLKIKLFFSILPNGTRLEISGIGQCVTGYNMIFEDQSTSL
jgi:hypothetical protein